MLEDQLPLLPLPLDVRSASPTPSGVTSLREVVPVVGSAVSMNPVVGATGRVDTQFMGFFGYWPTPTLHPPRRRTNHQQFMLYFLPATFTLSSLDIGVPTPRVASHPTSPFRSHRCSPSSAPLLPNKERCDDDLDTTDLMAHAHRRSVNLSHNHRFSSDRLG